ncbi:MAG: cupin domain-containing protein [Spirosomataceae bacterium]
MKRRKFLESTFVASVATSQIGIANASNPPKKGFGVKANQYRQKESIVYGDVPVDFKLLGSDTDNRLSVFISSNNRKGHGGPPLHVHHSFDEFFCVLSGSFVFELDGQRIAAQTGDSVFIPRGVKHTLYVSVVRAKQFVGRYNPQ